MTRTVRSGLAAAAAVLTALTAACAAPTAEATEPAYAAGLDARLGALADELLTTGAAVRVTSPQGDWTWTHGTRTFRGDDPVTVQDHVRIGSNTKPMTATVVLQLVDEGRLALDDPIARFRPDVPNGGAITIAQLLEMRSGLYNYSADPALNAAQDADPSRVWQPDEMLRIAYAHPPTFAPGADFEYSNTNYVLLGLVVEQLTGEPVGKAFQERIFDRIGMSGAHLPDLDDVSIPDPHPRGYTFGNNVDTMDTLVLPQDVQDRAGAGTLEPYDTTDWSVSWGWTAGSAIGTLDDLARFAEALSDGGLLSPEMQSRRLASLQPRDPADPSVQYGYGLAKFGPMYGHTGEIPGFNSFMGHDPETGTTVVAWATDAPAPDGRGPAVEMARAVIDALYGS